ncbi:hypothetical protein BKA67DRAFT_530467 [Truncatella angustata]|uniref:LysM domain-containing protein n=1 Tax=Truncatella angustata TaxID=152316 RepID=A0A9P8UY79_9PEZI|nr:uncharacterized protein BKA67DRAFT_530467 [Truncatella angustata]KAH6660368.1 hypothetical protein BKA67DRAFT_530467 [Truncatella angustata]KAH8201884.1 hypothetical protein TruAng_003971 [Truncatella angustata]
MGRWDQYDEDVPDGMTRIGYDSDDQTYTFRDADGSIWESAPGTKCSGLHCISGPSAPRDSYEPDDDEQPPPYTANEPLPGASWRVEMMPLFNFFLIIGLFLIGVFFYLRKTAGKMDKELEQLQCGNRNVVYTIQAGDTCWDLANIRALTVDELLMENANLDCDQMTVGQLICIPAS